MYFTKKFDKYVCDGDAITCSVAGFDVTARIHHDDDATSPEDRQDGFWPSLDPNNDGYIGPKSKSTLRRHMARAKRVMDAWNKDEWHYVGVAITVSKADVQLTGDFDHALWGIESNYPGGDGNRYLSEVAEELLPEALQAARVKLAELTEVR